MGRLLLTSSQVSALISILTVIAFTLALFFAGYAVQQKSIISLQQTLRPHDPLPRSHTPIHADANTPAASHHNPPSQPHPPIDHDTLQPPQHINNNNDIAAKQRSSRLTYLRSLSAAAATRLTAPLHVVSMSVATCAYARRDQSNDEGL